MNMAFIFALALLAAWPAWTRAAGAPFPAFRGSSLTGAPVSTADLAGRRAILIVTPSRKAARDTLLWAQALAKRIDQRAVPVRGILAIDRPFFMSRDAMLARARKTIPGPYHGRTWIADDAGVKRSLNIPAGTEHAYVFVLDASGNIVRRIEGRPGQASLAAVEQSLGAARTPDSSTGGRP